LGGVNGDDKIIRWKDYLFTPIYIYKKVDKAKKDLAKYLDRFFRMFYPTKTWVTFTAIREKRVLCEKGMKLTDLAVCGMMILYVRWIDINRKVGT
jgi:hypothetical protein